MGDSGETNGRDTLAVLTDQLIGSDPEPCCHAIWVAHQAGGKVVFEKSIGKAGLGCVCVCPL